MDPYRPANLESETTEIFPPPTRPLSAVLVAIASIGLGIIVFIAPYSNTILEFYRPRFGTSSPLLLVLPGACMAFWLFKPTIRLLMLAALLFLLIGFIFYFRTIAHTTLWGTVETVAGRRGERLDTSLFWCALPFVGSGLFLALLAGRQALSLARHNASDGRRSSKKQHSEPGFIPKVADHSAGRSGAR